jgi:hypothetical protein
MIITDALYHREWLIIETLYNSESQKDSQYWFPFEHPQLSLD